MIDFHCHLDLYPDPEMAVRQADEARVYVLSVTTTPKAWRRTSALAKSCVRIRTALGLHPELAHERHTELPLFEGLLPETRYVGEVGLDGSPEYKLHADVQKRVFKSILRFSSRQGGRVMSIHSRRASDEVLDCLRGEPDAGTPILHWFSGSMTQLQRAIDQGCWFSVGPPMSRSVRGRSLLASLPRDRVLTETDGPFGQDNGRALNPSDVSGMTEALAGIWNSSVEEVSEQLAANLRRLGVAVRKPSIGSMPNV
ncbi:TatD family hydrolase [Methylobacterium sp. E-016]|uniref:Qat anti-phage system TatD family nuclease QatD n=1 Tax=Methylobacterium sp. E-016 TaxID=2836556 RepID=UPI001FB868AD|nr:Qat anti-phage system TatD family nuclease QatD [Methylobacterium sp. E-016]MCJ2077663.1 TatD family hydrolase [Methylobacterium sp. E-016]